MPKSESESIVVTTPCSFLWNYCFMFLLILLFQRYFSPLTRYLGHVCYMFFGSNRAHLNFRLRQRAFSFPTKIVVSKLRLEPTTLRLKSNLFKAVEVFVLRSVQYLLTTTTTTMTATMPTV